VKIDYTTLPRTTIHVDATASEGTLDRWRHSIGQGGVNSLPLSERMIHGIRKLQPRLLRIFLQEYFNVYPDHGVFNWDKLDAYMDSFAATGAKVLATINLKPPVFFHQINHDFWRPNDIAEWQNLIYQLVRRYSVERSIVTHWENVNEPDIGEWGGCPYHISSIEDLHEFYVMLLKPILEAYPEAKVGGPCLARYEAVPSFVDLCAKNQTRLDFVSYHCYVDDPSSHYQIAKILGEKIKDYPGRRPELMINEWNKGFEPPWSGTAYDSVSVEEMSLQSRRAAHVAKIILTMMETPLDWSFYFMLSDGCMYNKDFSSFFSPEGARAIMYKHWNEAPHRFGLFSESGCVRPQYFVFQILSCMGDVKVPTSLSVPDLSTLVTRHEDGGFSVLVVNFDLHRSRDQLVKVSFVNLQPGAKRLSTYRIDQDCRWSEDEMELLPYEQRTVDTMAEFEYQFFSPADSVLWVKLDPL
jgi:xylan 1,4-beta-xylosidase